MIEHTIIWVKNSYIRKSKTPLNPVQENIYPGNQIDDFRAGHGPYPLVNGAVSYIRMGVQHSYYCGNIQTYVLRDIPKAGHHGNFHQHDFWDFITYSVFPARLHEKEREKHVAHRVYNPAEHYHTKFHLNNSYPIAVVHQAMPYALYCNQLVEQNFPNKEMYLNE